MGLLDIFKKKTLEEETSYFLNELKNLDFKSVQVLKLLSLTIEKVKNIDEQIEEHIEILKDYKKSPNDKNLKKEFENSKKRIGDIKKLTIMRNRMVNIISTLNKAMQKNIKKAFRDSMKRQ